MWDDAGVPKMSPFPSVTKWGQKKAEKNVFRWGGSTCTTIPELITEIQRETKEKDKKIKVRMLGGTDIHARFSGRNVCLGWLAQRAEDDRLRSRVHELFQLAGCNGTGMDAAASLQYY